MKKQVTFEKETNSDRALSVAFGNVLPHGCWYKVELSTSNHVPISTIYYLINWFALSSGHVEPRSTLLCSGVYMFNDTSRLFGLVHKRIAGKIMTWFGALNESTFSVVTCSNLA